MVELPDSYSVLDNNMLTADCATYTGIVFDGAFDGEYLEQKFREFVQRWPIIGGRLVTKV